MALRTPQLELNDSPWGRPALGSVLLHVGIFAALVLYALILAHLHREGWGQRSDTQGAIQATMVSSAPAIPLPQITPPKPDQVLATDTPSPAPAPPQPKAQQAEAQDSIPIPIQQKVKTRLAPERQVEQQKEVKVEPRHVRMVPAPTQPQQVPLQNRAVYGATQAYTPRSMTEARNAQQVQVQGGSSGFDYGWYVSRIQSMTAQDWYKQEVPTSVASGTRVYITFTLNRSGDPSDVTVERSSGNATLDATCVQAVQRVGSYGALPGGYTRSSLLVQYYCEM